MKYLVMNDPHLDVKAPSSRRTDDYFATCKEKLAQIRTLCLAHEVAVLVCTGDWFHKKNPQAVPHRLVSMLMEWVESLPCDVLTVIGNHDVQFADTEMTGVLTQPVGTLLASTKVHNLAWGPRRIEGVLFCGASYRPALVTDGVAREDPAQYVVPPALEEGIPIVQVTHGNVMPEAPIWEPYTLVEDLAEISRAQVCHTGHIHEDLGIIPVTRKDGSTFLWTNVGSITRGSLTEETIGRTPNVLLMTVETAPDGGVTFIPTRIPLECQPAELIYDVGTYREEKVRTQEFADLTLKLRQELDVSTEEETLAHLVDQSSLDHDARQSAHRILNAAGA